MRSAAWSPEVSANVTTKLSTHQLTTEGTWHRLHKNCPQFRIGSLNEMIDHMLYNISARVMSFTWKNSDRWACFILNCDKLEIQKTSHDAASIFECPIYQQRIGWCIFFLQQLPIMPADALNSCSTLRVLMAFPWSLPILYLLYYLT